MLIPRVAFALGWTVLAGAATPPRALPPQTIQVDVRGAVALVTVTRSFSGAGSAGTTREEILDIGLPARAVLLGVEVDTTGRFSSAPTVSSARPESNATKPDTTKPDTAKPDTTKPDTTKPDTTKPDTTKPDTTKPDTTKPDTTQPGASRPGATTPGDAYIEALRAMGATPREVPFDDEAAYRIRAAGRPGKNQIKIRYQFSTLVEIADGRGQIAFPAAPELEVPSETRVQVRAETGLALGDITIAGAVHPLRPGGAAPTATEVISTRRRWLLSLGFVGPGAAGAPRSAALTAIAARATTAPDTTTVACAVGLAAEGPAPAPPLPEHLLFVVDRSRSVGPGGLEAERDAAKRILMALPPSTRFDAIFFDRTQRRLFPVARAATREALAALEDEMVTARLANGTDLAAALRAAGALLRREANDFGPRALLVVLSDGAVGRSRLTENLGPTPGVDLMTAVLGVRPNDDPAISSDELRVLRGLPSAARLGGVEREIRTGDIPDAIPAALAALRAGGDVYAVHLSGRGDTRAVAESIAPGAGGAAVVSLKGRSDRATPLALSAVARGQAETIPLRPVAVEARWLSRLAAPPPPETRILIGPAVAALVEPVIHPAPAEAAVGPSGYLERSVVRDALSLAFTPRARACYLNRTGATPAERDLTGRVRLALDLVRGEVGAARIETSTLGHPVIESCLRDAAFALEVPRAYRNDEPVTAVLNLVFRPRTPERVGSAVDPGVNHEIDLVIDAALKSAGGEARDAGAPDAFRSDR